MKREKTTRKPLQKYNPGVIDEKDLESLKMGVVEELWDISTNFAQTDEILGDTFEKVETLEIDRDNMNVKIEDIYRLSVEGDEALAERITNLSSEWEADDEVLSSQITETNRVVSDLNKTMAENKLELESSISSVQSSASSDLDAAKVALDKAIKDGDTAEAERLRDEIEKLQGIIDGNKADIEAKLAITNTTITELDKAVASNKLELEASISSSGSNSESALNAAKTALEKAIADGDDEAAKALKAEVDKLQGTVDANKAAVEAQLSITNEAITNLDSALASNKLELESKITTASTEAQDKAVAQAKKELDEARLALDAAIESGDTAAADKLKAEIDKLSGIITDNKNAVDAQLSITNQTVAELDKAVAESTTEMHSYVGNAMTVTLDTADQLATGNLNEAKGEIDAKLSITNKTVADLEKATSTQITNLSSSFNGQFSTVNQTLSTHANKLGQVESKWGIEMDSNGKISGVSMNNNGQRSDFEVRADSFKFTDTSGNKSGGFSSSGGVTTFNGIVNAQAGVFNGTVYASGGEFNNVTIKEDCKVLGTLYADKIVGLPTGKSFGPSSATREWVTVYSGSAANATGKFNMGAMVTLRGTIKPDYQVTYGVKVILNGTVVHQEGFGLVGSGSTVPFSSSTPKINIGSGGGTLVIQVGPWSQATNKPIDYIGTNIQMSCTGYIYEAIDK